MDIPHQVEPAHRWIDPSLVNRNPAGQVDRWARPAYRSLSLRGVWEEQDAAWGGALANGMDWTELFVALASDPYTVLAPYFADPDAAQRTTVFGLVRGELGFNGMDGPFKQLQELKIEEIPSGRTA